jgi:hypothetical protein
MSRRWKRADLIVKLIAGLAAAGLATAQAIEILSRVH